MKGILVTPSYDSVNFGGGRGSIDKEMHTYRVTSKTEVDVTDNQIKLIQQTDAVLLLRVHHTLGLS